MLNKMWKIKKIETSFWKYIVVKKYKKPTIHLLFYIVLTFPGFQEWSDIFAITTHPENNLKIKYCLKITWISFSNILFLFLLSCQKKLGQQFWTDGSKFCFYQIFESIIESKTTFNTSNLTRVKNFFKSIHILYLMQKAVF